MTFSFARNFALNLVLGSIVAFSCVVLVAWGASDAVGEDAIDKMLREQAEIVSNMTLSHDNTGVQLERAEAGKRTFTYYYIMHKNLKTDYEPGQFKKTAGAFLKKEVCFSSHMKKDFFANGVTVKYVYQDKNKELIDAITITPNMCGY